MSLQKEIADLIKAEVITQDTADRILDFYKKKSTSSSGWLFVVFGVLGSILVGLGIILIIAHNWDELSRGMKTIFAFLPLLAGQTLCVYSLRKQDSDAWRESSATFLFFAVGASIALVAQIYNIPGGTGTFLFTWMLLCLPLVYLLNASTTSLLYISGITYYACHLGYWSYQTTVPYKYCLLLLLALPHYYHLYRGRPEGNFMIFHNWLIPASVAVTLGTASASAGELMYISYMSLFGLFYLTGALDFFARQKPRNHAYTLLGGLGTVSLLLMLSFEWFWEELRGEEYPFDDLMFMPEFYAAAFTTLMASVLFYVRYSRLALAEMKPLSPVFLLFIVTYIVGLYSALAIVLINLLVLAIGIMTMREGARRDHLGVLNFGLLVITALVICRFFDSDLSFVVRGLMFMIVGAGFFAANLQMLKKRRIHESE